MTNASPEPAPDGSLFQFETKPLLALTAAEQVRLRELTIGTPDSYMLASLRERPRRTQCFLARSGPTLVGWSLARWFKDFADHPRNAHLSVFVDPQWRRRGLGRILLGQAVAFSKEHRLVPWVYGEQTGQLAFYRACPMPLHISRTPFETK